MIRSAIPVMLKTLHRPFGKASWHSGKASSMESTRRRAFWMAILMAGFSLGAGWAAPEGMPAIQTDEASIRKLILALADPAYETRERAMLDLNTIGAPALPLLRTACDSDDPEVKVRATLLYHDISVQAVLDAHGNEALKQCWEVISGQNPKAREEAIHRWAAEGSGRLQEGGTDEAWVLIFEASAYRKAVHAWMKRRGPEPQTVEALLKILAVDPDGVAGFAAADALNLLCAPRLTHTLERGGSSSISLDGDEDPIPASKLLPEALGKRSVTITAEAQERLASTLIPPQVSNKGKSYMDQVRILCGAAGVFYRFDDMTNEVHLELPSQALAQWLGWWNGIKDDPLLLMDLGLSDPPEGAALAPADLDTWLGRLASPDKRVARVARRVLRDVPDSLLSEILRRAGAPGASPALIAQGERLSLRDKGWLLFTSISGLDGSHALYVMKLDGSSMRKVSGMLGEFWCVTPCGDRTIAYGKAVAPDGKEGIYRFDLFKGTAPERVMDAADVLWVYPSPDGRFLAILQAGQGGYAETLRVLDARTKAPLLSEKTTGGIQWSPDSRKLLWEDKVDEIKIHDFQTAETARFEACRLYDHPSWSPDGKHVAFSNRNSEDNAPVKDMASEMVIIDVERGERKPVSGPHGSVSKPAWSPDGKRIAFNWFERKTRGAPRDPVTIEVYDIATAASTMRTNPIPVPAYNLGKCLWLPGSKSLLYSQSNGMKGGVILDLDTGESVPREDFDGVSFYKIVPGTEWLLDCVNDTGIRLRHPKDGRMINLTESASDEACWVSFIPKK